MSVLLGDVHVDYLGADVYQVKSGRSSAKVSTRDVSVAMAVGRAIATAEGLVGGVIGSPCECPVCLSVRTSTIDSRPARDTVRRRRKCRACGARWTTEERTLKVDEGPALRAAPKSVTPTACPPSTLPAAPARPR